MKLELNDKQASFLLRSLILNYASTEVDLNLDLEIIGNLIKLDDKFMDEYESVSSNKWKSNAPLNKSIFCGNGLHSILDGCEIHKRLQYAFGIQSGMQQNGGMGTKFDQKSHKNGMVEIVSVIKDIMIALDVTIGDIK